MAKTKTEVATITKAGLPALPQQWQEELAAEAKAESAKETPSITNISFRAGVMALGGVAVPKNTMAVIVMESAYERCYYEGKFDPNKIKNPVCFALSLDGNDMAPHENSLKPQHAECQGCPMNEWGSAGEGRRGKACKEVRRLALIPADKVECDIDIKNSELALAKIPVTSVSNWSNYVHKVGAMFNMPFWAVLTQLSVRPHIKNQFEVFFDPIEAIEDVEALQALKHKRQFVEPFVLAPYSMATDEAEEVEVPTPKGKRKF